MSHAMILKTERDVLFTQLNLRTLEASAIKFESELEWQKLEVLGGQNEICYNTMRIVDTLA